MMIQVHEGVKKYGLQIIVWGMLISMLIGYCAILFDTRRPTSDSTSISTVNGISISTHTYQQAHALIEQRVQAIKTQFGAQAHYFLSLMGLTNTKNYTMNSLVSGVLLEQLADKAHIIAQPSYIPLLFTTPVLSFDLLSEVLPVSVFDQKGILSGAMLNNYLKSVNSSYAELEQMLLAKIKQSIIQTVARSCAHTLDKQLIESFAQKYQQRSYAYFILNEEYYLEQVKRTMPSDEQLREFYTIQNKKNKRYWSIETRDGSIVTFDASNWGIIPLAQEIDQYYAHHKALFIKNPPKLQVRHIVLNDEANLSEITQQLKNDPTAFEQLAQLYSQDSLTASKGGLMPSFVKGEHDPLFEKAAFAIRHDNDISDAVKTAQGIEIIQRISKTPMVYKSLQESKELIEQRLVSQKFSYMFNQFMSKWITDQTPTLKDLIAQKHAQGPTLISCIKSDTSSVAKKLFALKKDKQGFFVQKAQGILVNLINSTPARAIDFEQCKERVLNDYQHQQAEVMLEQKIKVLKQLLSSNILSSEQFKEIALEYGQSIHTTAMIDPSIKEQHISDDAIGFESLMQAYQQHTATVIPIKQGVAVVYVAHVADIDQQVFEDKKSEIKVVLNHTLQMTTLKGLVASLYRNATISNDKALDF